MMSQSTGRLVPFLQLESQPAGSLPLQRLGQGLALWLLLLLAFALLPVHFEIPAVFVALFALGPALVVGLLLRSLLVFEDSALYRWLVRLELPAAAICLSGLVLDPGWLAGFYALPWTLLSFGIALLGSWRLLRYGLEAPEELCLNLGLVFVAVGGSWLLLARLGLNPLHFGAVIVFLTAVHFHFAGLAACGILGASGRLLMRQGPLVQGLYLAAVAGAVLGIPLLALGITFSPLLEVLSAFVFAASLLLWAGLMLLQGLSLMASRLAKALMTLSALSVVGSMFWALSYALGSYLDVVWVSILQMGWRHGALNVLGFALPALLALALEQPVARVSPKQIPWSQLFGKGFIGPDFFQSIGAVPDTPEPQPTGLIQNFESYGRSDFEPQHLPGAIRDFYEQTHRYHLWVVPYWQRGFGLPGRWFRKLMDQLGQMALPVLAEKREDKILSQILPLDTHLDGRMAPRAWVRTYADTQKVVYAAAYSQHTDHRQTYMNIAFPLPFCQMSSILRLDEVPAPDTLGQETSLRLTSLPVKEELGDQGVYLVLPFGQHGLGVRLPINETIQVWTADQLPLFGLEWPASLVADTTAVALHDMWICGLHCLRLYYLIAPAKP